MIRRAVWREQYNVLRDFKQNVMGANMPTLQQFLYGPEKCILPAQYCV